jgi:hypothetical protein
MSCALSARSSQVNIQALMQNVHDLTDTTPAVPY